MAKQTKKILKKIHPKKKKWQEDKPQEKVGRDYLLIAVMAITILFLVVGWPNLNIINKVLYIMLTIALGTTYARRHYNLTEVQELWVTRAGYAAMAIALIAFIVNLYQNFIA